MDKEIWLAYTTDYDYDKRFGTILKESQFELGTIDDKRTWFYPKDSTERKRVNAFGLTLIKELDSDELERWQGYGEALSQFTSNTRAIKDEREKFESIAKYPKTSYPEVIDLHNKLLNAYDMQLKKERDLYLNAKNSLASFAPIIKKALSESMNVAYAKAQAEKDSDTKNKSVKTKEEEAANSKAMHYSEKKSFYPTGELKQITPLYKNEAHGFVKNFNKEGECELAELYYFGYETKDSNYKLFKREFTESDWQRVFYGNYGRGRSSLITRCFDVYNEKVALQEYMPLEGVFTLFEQKNDSGIFKFWNDLLNIDHNHGFFVSAFTPEQIELKKGDYCLSSNGSLIAAKPDAVKNYNLPLDRKFFSLTKAQSVLTDNPQALLEKKQKELLGEAMIIAEPSALKKEIKIKAVAEKYGFSERASADAIKRITVTKKTQKEIKNKVIKDMKSSEQK